MQVTNDMRILLAGCGSIGKRHARVLNELGAIKIAAADPNPEARKSMLNILPSCILFNDFDSALRDYRPDIVFVMTPTQLHIKMAITSILSGAHVFIEKPLSNTTQGVEELKLLANKHNKKVMIGFCFRYHEALLQAKQMIMKNAIGRLVSIRAIMGEPFYDIHPNYLELYYSRYSGAFELVHDLDLAIWFADQRVEHVSGYYGSYSDMGMQSPDIVEMLLRFEDRCMASVHLDFFQTPRRRQIDLIGTRGVVLVEFASWDSAKLSVFTRDAMQWNVTKIPTERNDMFRRMDREFLECVQLNKPVVCTIDEGVKSLQAIETIYRPDMYF